MVWIARPMLHAKQTRYRSSKRAPKRTDRRRASTWNAPRALRAVGRGANTWPEPKARSCFHARIVGLGLRPNANTLPAGRTRTPNSTHARPSSAALLVAKYGARPIVGTRTGAA